MQEDNGGFSLEISLANGLLATGSLTVTVSIITPTIGTASTTQHALPAGTDALLSVGSTATVTGKSMSGATNTFSAIPDSAITYATRAANLVWAGPASGADATPTFRSLVAADIPSLSGTYLPLAGGTMSGAITFSGTQLGTYTLGGTPTLGAALGVTTDGTDIGDATHRVDLFALTLNSGASVMAHTANVADSSTNNAFSFNNTTALTTSTTLATFGSNAVVKATIYNDGSYIGPKIGTSSAALHALPTGTANLLSLDGGTMSGAFVFTGSQMGTYTLAGTPTLGANLTVTAGFFVNVATNSATVPPALTWTAVTFQNNWVDYDTSIYNACSYYKDALGFVHVRGSVKSGTATAAIFTLPTGYRPAKKNVFPANANGTTVDFTYVNASGVVQTADAANTYISLDGVVFYAEQ